MNMRNLTIIAMAFLFFWGNAQDLSDKKKEYDRIFEQISNKGKWGATDKKGTVNYIDSEKILSALKLPKKGVSVSLSFDITVETTVSPFILFSDFKLLAISAIN